MNENDEEGRGLPMRRKGLTLIEIIISIALLGIISVSFLSAISTNFSLLNKTKGITSDVLLNQQNIELEIEKVKNNIETPGYYIDSDFKEYIWADKNIKVKYIEVKKHINGQSIFTIVSDKKIPELPVPEITETKISHYKNSIESEYAYALNDSEMRSSYLLNDPDDLFMINDYRWYVSNKGFNIPVPSTYPEIEAGYKYPKFPQDYTIIPKEISNKIILNNNIQELSDYGGRHIVLTATPAAKSGKIGRSKPSNPLYLHGLPHIDSLIFHLDASMISRESTTDVITSGSNAGVKIWRDISGNLNNASTSSNFPYLIENSIWDEFSGKYINLTGLKKLNIDSNSSIKSNEYNLFLAVKNNGNAPIIKKGDSWELICNDNKVAVRLKGKDKYNKDAEDNLELNISGDINNLKVIQLNITADMINLRVNQQETILNRTVVNLKNNSDIVIGNANSDMNIAEILMYGNNPSQADLIKVETYMIEKYKPELIWGSIVSLKDIDIKIGQNEVFEMPMWVEAIMSDGAVRNTPVTWSDNITTQTIGVIKSTGTSVKDPSKTMTLKVEVLPFKVTGVKISKESATLVKNETLQLNAEITPANATNKNVSWKSSNDSVAIVDSNGMVTSIGKGEATITVTTEDGNITDSCEISVKDDLQVLGYEARDIQTWTTGWWIFTTYHTKATIYIQLNDGTEYKHGDITEDSGWSYPDIDKTITGTAISPKSGESISYNLEISVEP